ncbi:type 2 isopentenyl-diphosphate Delta-isomerase [Candidatus Dojkabacteria bacterium]|nr:type 2 isopentenyl-diphosphate Delta-isomerase [Candidatus Dojkabacteria bacterium]
MKYKIKYKMNKIRKRKNEHLDIVLHEDVEPHFSYLSQYFLDYVSMPEIDMNEIETNFSFFGFPLSFPFYISSMTGGSQLAKKINTNIAIACEEEKIGFGLGSMRIVYEKPETLSSFDVKKHCPNIPMFTNLGIVQLNYGMKYDDIQNLIDKVSADGIFFHINHLQEAIQPEGNKNYKNLLNKFEKIVTKLEIPVIIKEVGHGIDYKTAKRLYEIGVKWIDVSGTGGTSWALIEGYRRLKHKEKRTQGNLGYIFRSQGIPTPEAILDLKKIKGLNIIAGGGVRSGLHIAISIALGANMATSARPFLKAATQSPEAVMKIIQGYKDELRTAMFLSGAKNLKQLSKHKVTKRKDCFWNFEK